MPTMDLIRLDKGGTALWFPDANQNARIALWIRDQRRAYQLDSSSSTNNESDPTPNQSIDATAANSQSNVDDSCGNKRVKLTTTDGSDNDTQEPLDSPGNDNNKTRLSPLQQNMERRYNLVQHHFRFNLLQLVGIDLTIDPDMTVVRKTRARTTPAATAQKSTPPMLPPQVTPTTKPATTTEKAESTPKAAPWDASERTFYRNESHDQPKGSWQQGQSQQQP
jgi:hypothetical protein